MLRLSIEAIDVLKWHYDGENANIIEPAFSISLETQGCSRGLCLKTLQVFTPLSPLSCLFYLLNVSVTLVCKLCCMDITH